jgi:TolB protein
LLSLAGLLVALCATGALAGDAVRLTHDSLFKRDPVFTQSGEAIVYVVLERPEQLRMVRLNLADGSTAPLHKDETRSELEPAFSPDGRFYAHLQSRSPASVAMLIHDTQQDQVAEIPPASGFSGMRCPAIAPDGSRVVYSFAEDGRQNLFSCDTQAADRKQLTDSIGINNWPHFSPDGKRLVFSSTRDGNYEVYAMNADGSDAKRLTDTPGWEVRPRFSPDGTRIAFTSNRDGNFDVYVMNADGSDVARLTQHPERDDYPAWHPDGKHLVTVSERAGRFDLYLWAAP